LRGKTGKTREGDCQRFSRDTGSDGSLLNHNLPWHSFRTGGNALNRECRTMSGTAYQIDTLIRVQLELNASVKSIAQVFGVGERRVRSFRDGVRMLITRDQDHELRRKFNRSFETNFLGDAQISDEGMAQMVNERFRPEEGRRDVTRQAICTVRNQLNIRYRPAFTVQNLSPRPHSRDRLHC
jgi:hypothetical protein